MGVLDSFVFLLSADEDDAVKGIERTGQAFEELKDKGQADSKAVADSFEDAGNKIGKTAKKMDATLSGIEGAAELSRSIDVATIDFIQLGSQAGKTGDSIFASILRAINPVKKLGDSADQAEPKVNKLAETIREKLGPLSDSLGIGDFAKGFIATAVAGMSLNAILDNTAELLNKIRDAETVGVDIGEYDALSRTFTSLGVDAEGFRDSMIDLNEAMGEAAADAESGKAKSFKTFGVELKTQTGQIKATDEALLELADSMSKMSKQQATFQIKQLGITDNKVIAAMLSGRKELEKMIKVQKEYGTLSQEDAEQVKKFSGAVNELKTMTGHFADELTIALAPAMVMTVDGINAVIGFLSELFTFLSDHEGLVAGILTPIAVVVLPMVTTALWGMATAAWAAIAPFLPFIALAVALGLVIDDLWTYFKGGDSVIGDLANKFTWLNDFLQTTKELFLELVEAVQKFANSPLDTLKDWGNSLAEGAKDLFSGDVETPYDRGASYAYGANSVVGAASAAPSIPSSSVVNSSRGGNTVQQTNDIKITVPSGDAETISRGVQQGLNGHLDSTMAEFDDGRSH